MRSIRMIVNTSKKRRRCVFADKSSQEMFTPGMFIDKILHVVDKARDEDQGTGGRFGLDCVSQGGWSVNRKPKTKKRETD